MVYLVYKMRLSAHSRRNMKDFWHWLEERESWFYQELPMVKSVRWYYSLVGDVYTIENWAAFDDEAGFGEYRKALASLKGDANWENLRVTQDEWWEFLGTRMVVDPPVKIGFGA
ncbi:MAG: hypothetical protein D4R44_05575 [Actinobacteria bacterium]|nr:MAG: hypothetical protein D4R44_05575 [Actinomycetota bacterium]